MITMMLKILWMIIQSHWKDYNNWERIKKRKWKFNSPLLVNLNGYLHF